MRSRCEILRCAQDDGRKREILRLALTRSLRMTEDSISGRCAQDGKKAKLSKTIKKQPPLQKQRGLYNTIVLINH